MNISLCPFSFRGQWCQLDKIENLGSSFYPWSAAFLSHMYFLLNFSISPFLFGASRLLLFFSPLFQNCITLHLIVRAAMLINFLSFLYWFEASRYGFCECTIARCLIAFDYEQDLYFSCFILLWHYTDIYLECIPVMKNELVCHLLKNVTENFVNDLINNLLLF